MPAERAPSGTGHDTARYNACGLHQWDGGEPCPVCAEMDGQPVTEAAPDEALAALCEATEADVRGFLLVQGVPWRVCPICGKAASDHPKSSLDA